MILETIRGGAEVEAEIRRVDDPFPRYEVQIEGIGYSALSLGLFSIVSATSGERVQLALGGYDLPEAQPKTRKRDPG